MADGHQNGRETLFNKYCALPKFKDRFGFALTVPRLLWSKTGSASEVEGPEGAYARLAGSWRLGGIRTGVNSGEDWRGPRSRQSPRRPYVGRPFKLNQHQQREAIARREAGEALTDIARTFGVHHTTIGRLRT